MRRAAVLILMILPLAACSLFQSKQTRALRRSPDYRAGYQDGCTLQEFTSIHINLWFCGAAWRSLREQER